MEQELNASAIRVVAAARQALEDARHEALHLQYEEDRRENLSKVTQAEADLGHLRVEFRRTLSSLKRNEHQQRDLLSRSKLLGAENGNVRDNKTRRRVWSASKGGGSKQEGPEGEALEMKLSLQRTRRMMADQLERVAQVSEIMGEQDTLLRDTYSQHQGIGGSLRRARTTLTRLKAADIMDTVFMVASTGLFFCTVCFVLYQRLPMLGLV